MQGAEVGPELRAALDAFRQRILDEFNGQGMGRRTSEVVQDFFRADIDAISDYLDGKRYFTGDRIRSLDASVYSTLKHIALQPHPWPGTATSRPSRTWSRTLTGCRPSSASDSSHDVASATGSRQGT